MREVDGMEDTDTIVNLAACKVEFCMAFAALCEVMGYVSNYSDIAIDNLSITEISSFCLKSDVFDGVPVDTSGL